MKKKLISLVLSLTLILSISTPAFADSEISLADESNLAYDLSLVRLNAAYDYLNEMYLDTNLGMYIEYATQQDIDTLSRLANDITNGCTTDEEKCYAIWNWMDSNVRVAFGSYAPIDVFRTMNGVCSGHAQLMSALMKLSGIKASIVRGYLIPTNETYLSQIYSGISEGHQWVMAYYNNDWYLFDDLWGECGNNDREDIASRYYTVNVDGISAYAEEIDTTKDEFNSTQTVYKDGEFIGIENGHITECGNVGFSMGGCLSYRRTYYSKSFDSYYSSLSGAVNTTYGYAVAGGYYNYRGGSIHYVKENGVYLGSTVVEYNNNLILMNDKSGVIIDEDIDNNGLTNGELNMYLGETIDLSEFYGDDTLVISLNKNIATVDGVKITAVKTGSVNIRVCQGNSAATLSIYVYGDARVSKDIFKSYCDHNETHIGCDECEYCDYCGMLIETVVDDIEEELEEAEEVVEETIEEVVDEVVDEVIENDEVEEFSTPTDIATETDLEPATIENNVIDNVVSQEPEVVEDTFLEEVPVVEDAPIEEVVEEQVEEIIEESTEVVEEPTPEVVEDDFISTPPTPAFANSPAPTFAEESVIEEVEEELPVVEEYYAPIISKVVEEEKVTLNNLSINFSFDNKDYQLGNVNGKYTLTLDVYNYVEGLNVLEVLSLEEIQNFLVDVLNMYLEDGVVNYNFIVIIAPCEL